jgi:hypothetical protein
MSKLSKLQNWFKTNKKYLTSALVLVGSCIVLLIMLISFDAIYTGSIVGDSTKYWKALSVIGFVTALFLTGWYIYVTIQYSCPKAFVNSLLAGLVTAGQLLWTIYDFNPSASTAIYDLYDALQVLNVFLLVSTAILALSAVVSFIKVSCSK